MYNMKCHTLELQNFEINNVRETIAGKWRTCAVFKGIVKRMPLRQGFFQAFFLTTSNYESYHSKIKHGQKFWPAGGSRYWLIAVEELTLGPTLTSPANGHRGVWTQHNCLSLQCLCNGHAASNVSFHHASLFQITSDFVAAATRGATAVVDGNVMAINPGEDEK